MPPPKTGGCLVEGEAVLYVGLPRRLAPRKDGGSEGCVMGTVVSRAPTGQKADAFCRHLPSPDNHAEGHIDGGIASSASASSQRRIWEST